MKFTKLSKKVQKIVQEALARHKNVSLIITAIDKAGGIPLLVGGAVRDALLNKPIHDLDIEVHKLPLPILEKILKKFGNVSLVGKAYGVFRLHGLDIDWSIPRADSTGRKPQVVVDPMMRYEQAFRRRDLTINAMGINLITYELVDPFNGLKDLRNNILHAPDKEKFVEDPLRFFRVMQFIGRLEMQPDRALNALCKKMNLKGVSVERIEQEFKKLFLLSDRPSLGLRWLQSIKRLKDVLPELAELIGVKQNPQWHPEGDVFEHTMQSLDAAAHLDYHNEYEKLLVMYAVLCHDLGKATTTKKIKGKLRSHGHAQVGASLTKKLLSRITKNKELIDAVIKLVDHHMMPFQLTDSDASLAAYKRLAQKLSPDVTMQELALVARADRLGRVRIGKPVRTKKVKEVEQFLAMSKKAQVLTQAEEPVLKGRDLMPHMQPGPKMGELLKKAYAIQLEEGIHNKEELKKRVL